MRRPNHRRIASYTSGINPAGLGNMELRLDTTSLSVAGPTQTLPDTSGKGRDAVQPSLGIRPDYGAGLASPNGKLGLGFDFLADGVGDHMHGTLAVPISYASGLSFYFVYHEGFNFSPTVHQTIWSDEFGGNPRLLCQTEPAPGRYGFVDALSGPTPAGVGAVSIDYHILNYIFTPPETTGDCFIYVDQALAGSANWEFGQATVNTGYWLGSQQSGGRVFAGTFYEMILFSEAHALPVMSGINQFLYQKWWV